MCVCVCVRVRVCVLMRVCVCVCVPAPGSLCWRKWIHVGGRRVPPAHLEGLWWLPCRELRQDG